jgi:hypothetical protein
MTLRPLFERVWSDGPRRRPTGATAVTLDPGGPLLSRPVGEVFATPS